MITHSGGSGSIRLWVLAAAALILAHTGWQAWQVASSPYPARYDYDEGVYAATAAAAAAPPDAGHAGPVRLYRDAFLSQPPLLITALAAAYRAFGVSLLTARLTVVLFSLLWLAAIVAIPAAAGRARAGVFALCALVGSRMFLTASHTVQMEAPSEALAAAAVALAVAVTRAHGVSRYVRPGARWWAAAGAAWGLAVMTKLTAAAGLAPLAGAAVLVPQESRATGLGALAAGAVLAAVPFLPQVASPAALEEMVRFHLVLAHRPGPILADPSAALLEFLGMGWPLVAAAAVGVGIAVGGRDRLMRLVTGWLAAECTVVLVLRPLWPHHLVALLSPLALLAGMGLEHLARGMTSRGRRAAAVVGACALAAYLGTAAAADMSGSSDDLRRMSGRITQTLPPDGAVLTDDPMVPFLARRPVLPAFIDTSAARFAAGTLSAAALQAALGDARVQAVLWWRGTFRREAPALEAAAAARFPVRVDAGVGQVLRLTRAAALSAAGGSRRGSRAQR